MYAAGCSTEGGMHVSDMSNIFPLMRSINFFGLYAFIRLSSTLALGIYRALVFIGVEVIVEGIPDEK